VVATESFPLASASYVIGFLIRVCGVLCGHGEHWIPCPRRTPFIWHCVRGVPVTKTAGAPDQGADGDSFINGRSSS
jgi:hypothetical protein